MRPDARAVLNDERVRRSLRRYFDVMQNDRVAKFKIASRVQADFTEDDSTAQLWKIHAELLDQHDRLQSRLDTRRTALKTLELPTLSLLDLKIEIAERIMNECHFCTRRCSVDRTQGQLGYCKCGDEIAVSTLFDHMGEEPELVPSGTIFTLGCTMRCLHCQNWNISQWTEQGRTYSYTQLAKEVEGLRQRGCRNANLVGGDPTPWLAEWLKVFKRVGVNIPVVWNSNAYYSKETAKLLSGFADVYLLDFKYGDNDCATRISDAPSYWETCTRNHLYSHEAGELIIRVLVLPNHLKCCTARILPWISSQLGPETRTNIMFQYRPEWRAKELPELSRRLTRAEMKEANDLARKAGLQNFIN
jgi:putative pyruvate formate lyase activating enzyme